MGDIRTVNCSKRSFDNVYNLKYTKPYDLTISFYKKLINFCFKVV